MVPKELEAGLAANQVGRAVRIAVAEVDHNPRYPYKPPIPLTVIVNPEIEPLGEEIAREIYTWDANAEAYDAIYRELTA